MNAFIVTVAGMFTLGAFISVKELCTEAFPMPRAPLRQSTAVIVLLVQLALAGWAWLLWLKP